MSTLATTTMRKIGFGTRWTGLPILPQDTPAVQAGDVYPSSRIIRRTAGDDGIVGSSPTWKAQPNPVGGDVAISLVTNALVLGYCCDTSQVDWPNVTLTHQRPRNAIGGIARWVKTIGTAKIKNGVTVLDSAAALEDRQPLLVNNTYTECRKLPPLAFSANAGPPPSVFAYGSATLTAIGNDYTDTRFALTRYLGGGASSFSFRAQTGGTGSTTNLWIVPVDPITLEGDVASAYLLGFNLPENTLIDYAGTDIEAGGVIRWDQFWIYATLCIGGPVDPSWSGNLVYHTPFDVPPPYDCPGVDGFIPGGYYT